MSDGHFSICVKVVEARKLNKECCAVKTILSQSETACRVPIELFTSLIMSILSVRGNELREGAGDVSEQSIFPATKTRKLSG